ncbi:unnamed protein product [Mesocestoides corti]|uniref:EML-like first beta-propeller domain-containing protein n=1 Tax=Mesocestoides corti TaxID=53468 RepID=A0A158QUX0_MESCO|nr:unnamed protein product [Mesocestoides corti]
MSNGGAGLDGLMTAERDELMERVAYLEKQTTDQAEELTCLKSALADCLRRVQVLETSRAGKMPSGPTPYPTGRQTRHMPRLPAASTMSSASKRPPSQVSLRTTTNVGLPSPSSAAAPGLKVGGSSGSGTLARPPTSSSKSGPRKRASTLNSVNWDLDSEDPSEPSTWITVYGLPGTPHVVHQRTTFPRRNVTMAATRHTPQSLRSRRKSAPIWRPAGAVQHDAPSSPVISPRPLSCFSLTLSHLIDWQVGWVCGVGVQSIESFLPPPHHSLLFLSFRSREPTYLRDEGLLRTYLRGRCLNFYAPTDVASDYDFSAVLDVPEEQLKLEWVYGYRGRDCRNNVYLLPTGEVIYFVAAVVVLYNIEQHSQRHYLGHNDDIKWDHVIVTREMQQNHDMSPLVGGNFALVYVQAVNVPKGVPDARMIHSQRTSIAVHPDKITIASGQTAGHAKAEGRPHVRIWNSVSLETLQVLGLGVFENSVACLSFSKTDGGAILAVIDEANDHTISLWEWQKTRRLTETKTSSDPVIAVDFSPLDANSLVSIGKNHLAFWNFDGSLLNKKQGVFDKYEKPKFVLTMVFAENGDLITGDSNGTIFVWPRGTNKIAQAVVGVHSGGIFALAFSKDGHLISGGGKDCRIVQLDADYNPTGVSVELNAWYGPVRTLIAGPGNMLIVGTTQGDILQCHVLVINYRRLRLLVILLIRLSFRLVEQGNLETEFSPLVQGHSDEFWALAAHPQTHHFLTSGRDGNVFLWDSLTKRLVWAENLSEEVVCACFYPAIAAVGVSEPNSTPEDPVTNGGLPDTVPVLAVGTSSGRWIVLDAVLHQVIAAHHESAEAIQCIAYSPKMNPHSILHNHYRLPER